MDFCTFFRPKMSRNKYDIVNKNQVIAGSTAGASSPAATGASASVPVFTGATESNPGTSGIVPRPLNGDQNSYLKGDSSWKRIPVSEFTDVKTDQMGKEVGIKLTGELDADVITTSSLNVTGSAHFWELIIDKVKSTGGNIIVTSANFSVIRVGDTVEYYTTDLDFPQDIKGIWDGDEVHILRGKRLWQRGSEDDGKAIANQFKAGDFVMCKTFNLDNNTNKYYWSLVLNAGSVDGELFIDVMSEVGYGPNDEDLTWEGLGFINATGEKIYGAGEFNPEVYDELVLLGNLFDTARQNAILISATDPLDTSLIAPAIGQYAGINRFDDFTNFRYSALAANGNIFRGNFKAESGESLISIDEDGAISIFNNKTGMVVQDGKTSFIGSVEVRPDEDGINTVKVFDSDGTERVVITPDPIDVSEQPITYTDKNNSNSLARTREDSDIQPGTYTPEGGETVYAKLVYPDGRSISLSQDYYTHIDFNSARSTRSIYVKLGSFTVGDTIDLSSITAQCYGTATYYWTSGAGDVYEDSGVVITDATLNTGRGQTYIPMSYNKAELYKATGDTLTPSGNAVATTSTNTLTYIVPEGEGTRYYLLKITALGNYNSYVQPNSMGAPSSVTINCGMTASCKIKNIGKRVMRIGSNGMTFFNGLSKYFYATEDGIDIRWGNARIRLNDDDAYIEGITIR